MPTTSPTLCDAVTSKGVPCKNKAVGEVVGQHYCRVEAHRLQAEGLKEISPAPNLEEVPFRRARCVCSGLALLESDGETWCCSSCGHRWCHS